MAQTSGAFRKCQPRLLFALIYFLSGLTPELSRTALRRRQSYDLSDALPTPRSGVGLNDLLDTGY